MTGRVRLIVGLFIALIVVLNVGAAHADKRVALVIGNSAYRNVPALANPKNDASDIAEKLKGMGFEVVLGEDLDLNGLRSTIRQFAGALDGADLALFFYAGHGLQVNGQNYIAPVDAKLASAIDLDFEMVPMDLVLSAMERATKTNLIFLDACRDNPLAENLARSMGTRSAAVGRGLAKIGSGVGSLIA
ncbi:MAG: caspase family protein, partial [Salaquimonas sp.]|nr:caspase family protein [Salaquimonas sp.]